MKHPILRAAAGVFLTAALASYGNLPVRADNPPATVGIEAESFQFTGDFQQGQGSSGASGGGMNILAGGTSGAPSNPAVTAVSLPRAGRYRMWVRTIDFPTQNPGTRTFKVSVGGIDAPHIFGASGKGTWTWESGGEYDLPAGPTLIAIREGTPFSRVDAFLFTSDLSLTPGPLGLGREGLPRAAKPFPLPQAGGIGDPLAAPGAIAPVAGAAPAARIESALTRIEWLPAHDEQGRATVVPRVWSKPTVGEWREVAVDPAAEAYAVIAGKNPHFRLGAFYPDWDDARNPAGKVTVSIGGVSQTTLRPAARGAMWSAGLAQRLVPSAIEKIPGKPNAVRLRFYPSPDGDLTADWELEPRDRAARITLTFTPKAAGSYSLGYETPWRSQLAHVGELLMPPTYERRRFPEEPVTALDCLTPTPIALAQSADKAAPLTWAVSGDPVETPFAWPNFKAPNFGLMIRDGGGQVHPAIYGPVPGLAPARCAAGQAQVFRFRLIALNGDWYQGYRTAADEVYGFHDYRENDPRGSLTDAILNMIDLFKDDNAGGWWPVAKANYQIESENGATNCAPLIPMSLYDLTGDEDILRRRALPTLEFMTSRNGSHFSPTYAVDAVYPVGGMDGPSKSFGTAVYAGLWEQTARRTPAFGTFAFPEGEDGIRHTASNSHLQPFDDWLARYEVTGDKAALAQARTLADTYLQKQIDTAPTGDIGWEPFFYISYTPDYEGLLRMYEATGEKKYLDGAAFGARQLMTGVWTQPLVPGGKTAVNDEGEFAGEGHMWWKGPDKYRLGFPRKAGDTPVRSADAWRVSNVGLSFEQPSTYRGGGGPGQMIYQSVWAPAFLRLARYTGDRTFETYARNAVVGRWTNYPGYYATGLTDIHMAPDYPFTGPDVSSIYYHHIPSHLGWTIDYLISEAELRSKGQVSFPSLRQLGYAYFDGRVFGHAPGHIGPIKDTWLWFRRGLVTLDNPQINYVTAHTGDGHRLVVVLMNESARVESVKVNFDPLFLGMSRQTTAHEIDIVGRAPGRQLPLRAPFVALRVPPHGLTTVVIDDCNFETPVTQRVAPPPLGQPAAPKAGAVPSYATVKAEGGFEARGSAIQLRPGPWDAYIWCTATPKQVKQVTVRYRIGDSGEWKTTTVAAYPFETSVPVADAKAVVHFIVSGVRAGSGAVFTLPEAAIAAPAP